MIKTNVKTNKDDNTEGRERWTKTIKTITIKNVKVDKGDKGEEAWREIGNDEDQEKEDNHGGDNLFCFEEDEI